MGHPLKGIPVIVLLFMSVWSPGGAAQELPGVQLETVSPGTIRQEVTLNGTVTALRVSGISASVAGLLEQVQVETGNRVARGDTLVALDDELVRWELEAASAEVEEARSRLEEAERRLSEARSVGAGRNIAATEVSTRESEVEASRAALARLEATRRQVAVRLERHRVTAPFDGVISQRSRDIGEWVTTGDQLLTLVDTGNLRLDFQVPQDFYARVDDNTRLLVQAEGDRVPASIDVLVPVNDPQARTFLLRAIKPDPVRLLPGMAVQATLQVTTGEQGLTISRDAINRYPEGRVTVWLAEPADGDTWTVREKRVYLGAGFDGKVEVTRGLEQGQKVVVRGNESLTEGMRVQISERESR
ncbi:RND family efflux transporter, MFP subunit [Marinobacter gudaonensis]|uniref:RND family efflux transporter, MFP subunit n=1 Tax=Marinobacter gudaonensis TaxID=375760 RepID=A0A1I6H456_9GAMM|nr:efflux RND transporter periplasmic adaptor subunit [Marinobacter gudaonensis]SFR49210.1 RND family efflux transporter, MFP subunit [Marinobacter gudaonensis]